MVGEYQVGNEDEDPRVRLDRLEQGMATLTSMVSQLLEAQCKETPSIELGHGEPKREEKKPEAECKVEPEMGECNYSKTQVPFVWRPRWTSNHMLEKLMPSN
jgi:hypothetical protein